MKSYCLLINFHPFFVPTTLVSSVLVLGILYFYTDSPGCQGRVLTGQRVGACQEKHILMAEGKNVITVQLYIGTH